MKTSISIFSLYNFWKRPIIIDIVLILAFAVSLFFSIKLSVPVQKFDYSSFFLNLSASFLSIWVTIRLIDNLINKREKLRLARQTLFENLKHPLEYITRFYPRLDDRDYEYLKREINWFDKKWGKSFYVKILKDNEEPIARKLFGLNMQVLSDVYNVSIGYKLVFNCEEDKEMEISRRLKSLSDTLRKTETEIENLANEVWKTDKPISL
jgi:hypothetical protein